MLGIPIEATPDFPADKDMMILTESASADPDLINKLREYVQAGGDAVITSGLLRKLGDEIRDAGLTEATVTDRKLNVTRYHITGDEAGYIDDVTPILFPEITHGNNDSWSLLNGGDGDYHTPLLLLSIYGEGRIYILNIPDNYADIYRIPRAAADVFKRILRTETYASGKDFSMFTYDDGSFILYRYVKDNVRPAHVKLYTKEDVSSLKDEVYDEKIPVAPYYVWEEFELKKYMVADIILEPGVISKFKWEYQ